MSRKEISLAAIVLPVTLLLVFMMGLFAYMGATKTTLHPDLQQVRSVTHPDPSRKWTGAVERGRHVMRAGLTQQNLPGLSVAVGVDGDIVSAGSSRRFLSRANRRGWRAMAAERISWGPRPPS